MHEEGRKQFDLMKISLKSKGLTKDEILTGMIFYQIANASNFIDPRFLGLRIEELARHFGLEPEVLKIENFLAEVMEETKERTIQ